MDVVVAPGASVCDDPETPDVFAPDNGSHGTSLQNGHRMRLYLVDLPAGGSARILAIAVAAPERRFDRVAKVSEPVVDSIEFHVRSEENEG
jgi:hypothetical protein